MKNLKTLLLSGSYILLLTLIGCAERTSDADAKTQPQVDPPQQIISLEEAKKMYEMYGDRRVSMIQRFEDSVNISKRDTAKFDVARYTFYDYKTIKQYLAYIEQEAAKTGVEISTIRFYYSNYPDQEKFANGKPIVHPRQNSFFIIPALESDGEQYAFTIEGEKVVLLNGQLEPYEPKGQGSIQNHTKKSYAGVLSVVNFESPFYANGSTILNEGNAAPPPHK